MRLRNSIPAVKFRADLPKWMEPKGAAFIEIDARPAGNVNSAWLAASAEVSLANMTRLSAAKDDEVATLRAQRGLGADFWVAVFDTCVIAWRTNLIDDATGAALTCDRETFLELANVSITEISGALIKFQAMLFDAAKSVAKETDAIVKN